MGLHGHFVTPAFLFFAKKYDREHILTTGTAYA
jgi:hypothetical protein